MVFGTGQIMVPWNLSPRPGFLVISDENSGKSASILASVSHLNFQTDNRTSS